MAELQLVAYDQELPPETTALRLLTDLSLFCPSDLQLDFEVDDFPLEGGAMIGIMIDDEPLIYTADLQIVVEGLAKGYHLLRCFLINSDKTCVKSELAYVEAEFYVKRALVQMERPFMFGQPALAVILCEQGFVDFFVHNCMVEPQGFHVSIAVDREEVGTVDIWTPHEIQGLTPGEHNVRVALVNPKGDLLLFPPYNAQTFTITVD